MSYLLANGCSFTDYNFGKNTGEWRHTLEEKEKLGIPDDNWPMWPEYVAEKLELPHLNLGQSGASNEQIYLSSLYQIQERKPKLLIHLWSSSRRHWLVGSKSNLSDFCTGVAFANEILHKNPKVFDDYHLKPTRSTYSYAFRLISIHYPEKFNEIINFYSYHLSEQGDKKLFELTKYIRIHSDRVSLEDLNNGHFYRQEPQSNTINFWFRYFHDLVNKDEESIKKIAIQKNNWELSWILSTHYMCKSEEIPFIGASALSLDGGHMANTDKMEKYNHLFQDAGLNHFWRRFSRHYNREDLNLFEQIILIIKYFDHCRQKLILESELFHKLDELVHEKELIYPMWPPMCELNSGRHRLPDFLEGWEQLSDKDSHPSIATQKLIGDFFYEAYQEFFS